MACNAQLHIEMMHSVLLQCSVNAEIRAVDSQSDLRIIVVINSDIFCLLDLQKNDRLN